MAGSHHCSSARGPLSSRETPSARSLYDTDATGWLAVAKIAMGTPLLALALLVVFWAFRRSTERLTRSHGTEQS